MGSLRNILYRWVTHVPGDSKKNLAQKEIDMVNADDTVVASVDMTTLSSSFM